MLEQDGQSPLPGEFHGEAIISHTKEKCDPDHSGLQKGTLRMPEMGPDPARHSHLFLNLGLIFYPNMDFNLFDKLSLHDRECTRQQLLLIAPPSFTAREGAESSKVPPDGLCRGQMIVPSSISVVGGGSLSRRLPTFGCYDQFRGGSIFQRRGRPS